jgi:hypothetical protein
MQMGFGHASGIYECWWVFSFSGFWGWWPFGLEGEWDLVLAGIQVGLCNRKMGFGVYRWVEGLWGF